jgi:hypothetical protein
MDNNEEWRVVAEFPTHEVSSLGRARRIGGRILALSRHKQGYWLLTQLPGPGGKKLSRHIHRLVALAFNPNPLGLPVVRHEDDDTSNAKATNLVWSTQGDNIRQAMQRRGNWLAAAPKHVTPIIRIDAQTGAERLFPSITAALDDYNALVVANGGTARPTQLLAGNVCHARDQLKVAFGFYWVSPRKRLALAMAREKVGIALDIPAG